MRKNLYNNFIGIDIGKHELVSHLKNDDKTRTYENNRRGYKKFPREHKDSFSKSLVSLEATGGYESACLNFLLDKNIAVHRADARKVKNFIRSFGQHAKTDVLDAKALSQYAYERPEILTLYQKAEKNQQDLKLLIERRQDLKQMLVLKKNRYQAPLNKALRPGIQCVITCLEKQIDDIENLVVKNKSYRTRHAGVLAIVGSPLGCPRLTYFKNYHFLLSQYYPVYKMRP